GLDTFGYGEEVVFPIAASAADPSAPLRLVAQVDYLVCAEICVPHSDTLRLELPPGTATPARESFLIDRFASRVPGDGAASGLALEAVGYLEQADGQQLVARVRSAIPLTAPDLLVEADGGLRFAAPAVELAADRHSATLRLPVSYSPKGETPLLGRSATLTVVDGLRGLERDVTLAPLVDAASPVAAPAEAPG